MIGSAPADDLAGSETAPARSAGPSRPRRRRGIRARLGWVVRRLRSRPDSEHEMTANRLVFAVIVLVWLAVGSSAGDEGSARMLALTAPAFGAFFVTSMAIFVHILWRPAASVSRRLIAMVLDFAMISYAAWAGGASAGFFYPLFLWTVFGNGFRFGVPYLYAAMAVSTVGFVAAVAEAGFWTDNHGVTIAMLVGLIILPLYAGVLIRKLSEAKRLAEEANRAKSLFLASVSHELRTPLNAIIGFSDLLSRMNLKAEQADMVRTVSASGRSLLSLIDGILDYSRMEAGRMPSVLSRIDLPELLEHVRSMLAVQAQAKGLRFDVEVGEGVPVAISGDQRHLEEVLVNLASNAVKFTPSGFVRIAVSAVTPSGEQVDGRVRLRFEVADSGIGIAPEAQARVFESFTQADETIIDRFGGTGLGLAIVKQLVELQGGTISLRSNPGEGSTFWFELGYAVASSGEAGSDDRPSDQPSLLPSVPSGRLRVLIAEDNKTNQMVLAKLLETAGHDVATADNGEAALDRLRDEVFDVVLMDVNMPIMNGIETTKLFRFMSLGRERTPIVGLTADATPEARSRCLDAGMDAVATKPIDSTRLLAVIASALPPSKVAEAPTGPSSLDALQAFAETMPARRGRILDDGKLDDLERLGGAVFVEDLAAEFLSGADLLVDELAEAVADGDSHAFRLAAHSLRSSAANIGAESLFTLCLSWREIGDDVVAESGEDHVRAARLALARVREALTLRFDADTWAGDTGAAGHRAVS